MLRGLGLVGLTLAAVVAVTWGWWPVALAALAALGSIVLVGAAVVWWRFRRWRVRHQLASLARLDPIDFEQRTARWFARDGWKAEHRGGSNDRGIDVLLRHGDATVAVQCKRYRPERTIEPAVVRELYGAALAAGAAGAVLVTTAQVSQAALDWRDALAEPRIPLELLDGAAVVAFARGSRRLPPKRLLPR